MARLVLPCAYVVWEPATGRSIRKINGVNGAELLSFAWSPDGKSLAVTCGDTIVRVVNSTTGEPLFDLPRGRHRMASWAPDGRKIATFDDMRNFVNIWDAQSGALLRALEGEATADPNDPNPFAWSADGSTLACYEKGGGLRLWDVASGNVRQSIERRPISGSYRLLAYSPDGKTLAASDDKSIRFFETERLSLVRSVDLTSRNACIAWSPDSTKLAGLSQDVQRSYLWDAASGHLSRQAPSQRGLPRGFSPDLRAVALDFVCEKFIMDPESGRTLMTLVTLSNGRLLFVSPGGHYRSPGRVDQELVYVVETDRGQETLTPEEFSSRFGWKNDPDRVRIAR